MILDKGAGSRFAGRRSTGIGSDNHRDFRRSSQQRSATGSSNRQSRAESKMPGSCLWDRMQPKRS